MLFFISIKINPINHNHLAALTHFNLFFFSFLFYIAYVVFSCHLFLYTGRIWSYTASLLYACRQSVLVLRDQVFFLIFFLSNLVAIINFDQWSVVTMTCILCSSLCFCRNPAALYVCIYQMFAIKGRSVSTGSILYDENPS
jgi:hypothetical protein